MVIRAVGQCTVRWLRNYSLGWIDLLIYGVHLRAHGALLLSSTVGKSQQKHKNVQVDCQTYIQPSTTVFPKIVAGNDYFFFGTKRGRLFEGRQLFERCYYKQLLDEVFVISGIIKAEVSVISQSQRLRLITLTETLIIPDITKTESNNCFIILYLQVISQFLAGSMKWIEKPFLLRCPGTWHCCPCTWHQSVGTD